jgi:transposase
MKLSKLLTIQPHDIESARESVKKYLPQEELEKVLAIIAAQEYLIKIRDKIIEIQRAETQGLFNLPAQPAEQNQKSAHELATQNLAQNGTEPSSNDSDFEEVSDSPGSEPSNSDESTEPEKNIQRGKRALEKGECHHNHLAEDSKICPCCSKKMVKCRTHVKTVVYASKVLHTRTEYSESARCESCNVTNTAPTTPAMQQTIGRYHFSAVASLAALRYLYGMASYRMEEYSKNVGLKISDSTQWKLFEDAASMLRQFVLYLNQEAANASVCHTDDTYQTIHELVKEIEQAQLDAIAKGKRPETVRSGVKTTNVTVVYPQGKLVLYRSGLHHAGEILAQNLELRSAKEALIVMMDALSANTSKLNKHTKELVKVAYCNAHAVRKFKELGSAELEIAKELQIHDAKISEEIDYFLRGYARVFKLEKETQNMTPEERLLFHQKNSLPVMEQMLERTQKLFANKKVEPSSDIGKVYQYLINHWNELTTFCREPGAPLDNNTAERALKGAIRHRRNSLFFKNQVGAIVGDILTSILMTAKENGLNPVEYLQNLLTYREAWKQNPANWLHWNYASTLASLQTPTQS